MIGSMHYPLPCYSLNAIVSLCVGKEMPPGTTKPPRRLTNRLPGFGVRVSSFVFRVSGFWFWVSGFGFLVSGFWFLASGFEFRKYQSGRTPKKPAAQGHKLSGSSKVNTPKSCPRIWWGARNLPLGNDERQRPHDEAVVSGSPQIDTPKSWPRIWWEARKRERSLLTTYWSESTQSSK